jgi:hypothetical protein
LVDIYVIHRTDEIAAVESSLEFPLVAVVDGTGPSVTIPEVHHWLRSFYQILPNSVIV